MKEENIVDEIIELLLLLPEKYGPDEKVQILDFYYKYNLLDKFVVLIQNYSNNSVSDLIAHKFSYELSYCSISVKMKLIQQINKICAGECRKSFHNYLMNYKEYLDEEIV